MRIVAGSAKGTRLAAVPSGTRPLADRAREGLFSSLGGVVAGARVLDLYAGTGAVGIEALSRGAVEAVFVDEAPAAVRAVGENLRRARLVDRGTVLRRAVPQALRSDIGPFDLVFLDPPYAIDPADVEAVLSEIAAHGLCAPGALVILTRERKNPTPVIPLHWALDRRLSYGGAVVLVFRTYEANAQGRPGGVMGRTALCPGTFDPVTNGHLDIVRRASAVFDTLVVAVLENPAKAPLFSVQERVEMLREAVAGIPNVEVAHFRGLLVDFARARGAPAIVKGLRAVTDFDYELQMAQMNHHMSGIETLFMPTNPQWSYLSSSLVKEISRFGGDVDGFVPGFVAARLRERLVSEG